jgi:predicted DCC family thiol-disulfide oxidoreductase YuxK
MTGPHTVTPSSADGVVTARTPAAPGARTVPVVQFTIGGRPRDDTDQVPFFSSAGFSGVGEGRPYTLVYDGNCKVCGRLVGLLRAWDGNSRLLEIVPSQMPGVPQRFPWIPPRAFGESIQLVGPEGRTWDRAGAIEQLLDVLPRGGVFAWVFRVPFMRRLTDRFYRWFARNRYRLGCGEHCSANLVAGA